MQTPHTRVLAGSYESEKPVMGRQGLFATLLLAVIVVLCSLNVSYSSRPAGESSITAIQHPPATAAADTAENQESLSHARSLAQAGEQVDQVIQ